MANRDVWSLEAQAFCDDCDWRSVYERWAGNETVRDVCNQAARHVNETGHTTRVENMKCIQFSPGVENVLGITEINHPICDNHPEVHDNKSVAEIMRGE